MLQPGNRLTLVDAMRPPLGFGLDSAMAVTFTLDLRALLAAPAAFVLGATSGGREDAGQTEPVELLHALRSHAGRLTVFSQVGEIALPPARRVFTFLERVVVPVTAPLRGVVHPKVWVLRYSSEGSAPRLRVLVGSRNLTFDESWDTIVRLDESADGVGADLSQVGRLFDGLLRHARGPVAAEHAERVNSLVQALETTRFALPAGVDELNVHVLGFATGTSPLPADVDRSLIVSPFVNDEFFTSVHPHPVDALVSRPESLDRLGEGSRARIGQTYTFDDGSAFELRAADERRSPRDPGRPLVGLHAKVFAFERGRQARVLLGSANATGAAFARNIEILLELVGAKHVIGIDRLCGGTDDENGLDTLFLTYDAAGGDIDDVPVSSLDAARRQLAGIPVEGVVEESGQEWAVTYRTRSPVPHTDGLDVECWPLSTAGNRRPVPTGQPLEVRFETALENVCAFLAFRIAGDEEETAFVVPVDLAGVPEARDRALLRALIGSSDRFFRYLLAMLDDDPGREGFLDIPETAGDTRAEGKGPAGSTPVLEKLVRAMRRDPAKLAALHPLISDLSRDNALPAEFGELWALIHEAAFPGGDGA